VSFSDQFVTANGVRLHYCEWGNPDAPAVVLLHGGSAHAHWWDLFAAAIADAYRVLAFDLRGHGDSAHVSPPAYTVADMAADIAAAIETLGLTRIHLVGHSLGGMVAANYVGRVDQRLHKVVIVDTQLRISTASARYLSRLRNFPQVFYNDYATAIRRFRLLPTQTNAAPDVLTHVAAHSFRQLPDGSWTLKLDREVLAQTESPDPVAALQASSCRILFVRGEHSTVLPRERLRALRAVLPRADAREILNAHHHVMLDNPDGFAKAVRGFLDAACVDLPRPR
jgi:pimeloyl-ACP methyl ester carboxylesterase